MLQGGNISIILYKPGSGMYYSNIIHTFKNLSLSFNINASKHIIYHYKYKNGASIYVCEAYELSYRMVMKYGPQIIYWTTNRLYTRL